jgi:hypothetical protein
MIVTILGSLVVIGIPIWGFCSVVYGAGRDRGR